MSSNQQRSKIKTFSVSWASPTSWGKKKCIFKSGFLFLISVCFLWAPHSLPACVSVSTTSFLLCVLSSAWLLFPSLQISLDFSGIAWKPLSFVVACPQHLGGGGRAEWCSLLLFQAELKSRHVWLCGLGKFLRLYVWKQIPDSLE